MNRIQKLQIKGLFGRHDYTLNLGAKEGYAILAAPNGYGKSTILQLIRAIQSGNLLFFDELIFSEIHVEYVDSRFENFVNTLDVYKRPVEDEELNKCEQLMEMQDEIDEKDYVDRPRILYEVEIRFKNGSCLRNTDDGYETILFNNTDVYKIAQKVSEQIPELELLGKTLEQFQMMMGNYDAWRPMWEVKGKGRVLTLSQVFNEYEKKHHGEYFWECSIPMFSLFVQSLSSDHIYVSADRRIFAPDNEYNGVVNGEVISDVIADMGKALKEKALKFSQTSRDVLAAELLKSLANPVDERELKARIESKIQKLKDVEAAYRVYGIERHKSSSIYDPKLDIYQVPENASASELRVLDFLLDSALAEMAVYEDFVEKLSFYEEELNGLLSFARIEASIDGITAWSTVQDIFQKTGEFESPIALNRLSSGESHLLTLLGLMIFFEGVYKDCEGGAMVLIDEPEVSLHPLWQEKIAEFFWKCLEKGSREFVFATHSPMFIGTRWDKVIELAHL